MLLAPMLSLTITDIADVEILLILVDAGISAVQ